MVGLKKGEWARVRVVLEVQEGIELAEQGREDSGILLESLVKAELQQRRGGLCLQPLVQVLLEARQLLRGECLVVGGSLAGGFARQQGWQIDPQADQQVGRRQAGAGQVVEAPAQRQLGGR